MIPDADHGSGAKTQSTTIESRWTAGNQRRRLQTKEGGNRFIAVARIKVNAIRLIVLANNKAAGESADASARRRWKLKRMSPDSK